MFSHRTRVGILFLVSLAGAWALIAHGPIAQDPAYHRFADARQIVGITNFWNVVSNLPFVLVGIVGLLRYSRITARAFRGAYFTLCVGVVLIGIGSSDYHFNPSNATLVWDRLPMTVAFMALLCMLISERVKATQSRTMLFVLIGSGISSVLYWAWSESIGKGDLRPYVLAQFLPLALIPLIVGMFKSRFINNAYLLGALALYIAAKVFEHFDAVIMLATGDIGGHALKHLTAAAAVLFIVLAVPTEKVSGLSI